VKVGTREDGKGYTLMQGSIAYDTDAPAGKDSEGKPVFTNFVNFQSWSEKLIAYLSPKLKKGQWVQITGEPVINTYTDDKGKHSRLRIAVEEINLLTVPKPSEANAAAAASV
jgi:single-stranded DNA-binding protein